MSVDPASLRLRAAMALSFALARYVPIPILDDLVRERIARLVVARAATVGGHPLEPREIAVLGASSEGCLGCLGAALWFPIALLLYPVRLLLGIRWLGRDLVEIFALGRTIDRLIEDGRYPLASPIAARLAYARDVRRAFDLARRGLDVHAVQGLLSIALGPIRAIVPASIRSMRRFWHGDDAAPSGAVDAPASRLATALGDPRMKELLEEIDRRFDDALFAERAKSR